MTPRSSKGSEILGGLEVWHESSEESLAGEVTITKDTITIKGGDMTHVMAYKIDTKATPVAITLTGKEGRPKTSCRKGSLR